MANRHTQMTAKEVWAVKLEPPAGCQCVETKMPCGSDTYTLYFDYLTEHEGLTKVRIIAYSKPVLVTYPDGEKVWQGVNVPPYEKKIYTKQLRGAKPYKKV